MHIGGALHDRAAAGAGGLSAPKRVLPAICAMCTCCQVFETFDEMGTQSLTLQEFSEALFLLQVRLQARPQVRLRMDMCGLGIRRSNGRPHPDQVLMTECEAYTHHWHAHVHMPVLCIEPAARARR